MTHRTNTITALATAPQPAGLAVIRVSGPDTRQALNALFRGAQSPTEKPRYLAFGNVIDVKSGEVIDEAQAVYMPGPFSYTGEDVGEFQLHGSPLIVQKILRSLFAFGITPAEPGEFTKRAFLNGKIDLIQAEAVADLIGATSDSALRVANEQLKGNLSTLIDGIAEPLRNLLAEIEARIDFPEEEIPEATRGDFLKTLSGAERSVQHLLKSYAYGQVLREGFRVLLAGPPNAGKSSLLNRLLGRERVIVSPIPGTTRDLIEESLIIDGHHFVFCDSAGLSTVPSDAVEARGIELARERLSWADLVLFVVDPAAPESEWRPVLGEVRATGREIWMVVNKTDTNPNVIGRIVCAPDTCTVSFYVSASRGDGIEMLREALAERVRSRNIQGADTAQIVTSERHRECLSRAGDGLIRAERALSQSEPLECAASELRIVLHSLEELVGKTYTEDILGRIFSRFCIGK